LHHRIILFSFYKIILIFCLIFLFGWCNDLTEGKSITFFQDGKINNIGYYKNSKKHGKYIEYWENGKLCIVCNYKNHAKYGKLKSYDFDGKLYEIANYVDDMIIWKKEKKTKP
jgi:antitoxin component YwqK of YwqJK toxin-antitoxin module